jgi:hypothetical protein
MWALLAVLKAVAEEWAVQVAPLAVLPDVVMLKPPSSPSSPSLAAHPRPRRQ